MDAAFGPGICIVRVCAASGGALPMFEMEY